MGLDITAFKKLKKVETPEVDKYGYPIGDNQWCPGESMVWSEQEFPGRGKGIEPWCVYTWGDIVHTRIGSYSSYNGWRDVLEEFRTNKDFEELIEFADNEGVIGYVVAEKLAKDFEKNLDKAKKFSDNLDNYGEGWFNKYLLWKEIFEFASDEGAVDFH
ncbi:MAG: hypothetical protein ACRC36_05570 [Lacrimispora sphenoides]